jgi:hypothetical protein
VKVVKIDIVGLECLEGGVELLVHPLRRAVDGYVALGPIDGHDEPELGGEEDVATLARPSKPTLGL